MRVCIEGNIGAGKSTLLSRLAESGYPVHQEPVGEWKDWLDLFYSDKKRWAFGMQMRVLASLLEYPKTCVAERSTSSTRHVFAQVLYNQGDMSEKEFQVYKQYFDATAWTPQAIVYVDVSPEACFERIRERARPCEDSIDLAYIKKLDFHYHNLLRYANYPVHVIDGNASIEDVYTDALAILQTYPFDTSNVKK
jgi:deoxyadenosine/deoxycytidine kinase